MVEHISGNGTCGLTKDIAEDIVQLEIGNGEAIESAVFLAGEHIGQLHAVAHEVAKLANVRGRNKAGFDHVAHEQVADPPGVLAVGLIALLGFGILGMSKGDGTGLFKNIEYGNPVLTGGFHTDFRTVVFGKPM